MTITVDSRQPAPRIAQFIALTKPRVVSLIVFTAVIGMFLATPGMVPLQVFVFGTLGFLLASGLCLMIRSWASGWWRVPRRPSIAWSSRKSMR